MQKIPDYADHMTLDEFLDLCEGGMFVSSDGDGHWSNGTMMDWNSCVWSESAPEWATHVAWFNK